MAAATAMADTADINAIADTVATELAMVEATATAPQSAMPAHGSASSWADRIPAIRTAATSVIDIIDITVTTDADITVADITAITAITRPFHALSWP